MRLSLFETNRYASGATEPPQLPLRQTLTANLGGWIRSCYVQGVRSEPGFTLLELLVIMALIGILSAVAIPTLQESTKRNALWTASETIGMQIRQARLKAISRNRSFRIRFDCPAARQFRVLEVTGNATIDNATNRCSLYQTHDSGVYAMPSNVTYGTPPVLTVNSRGAFSSTATITVTNGTSSRELSVSLTGQINFGAY